MSDINRSLSMVDYNPRPSSIDSVISTISVSSSDYSRHQPQLTLTPSLLVPIQSESMVEIKRTDASGPSQISRTVSGDDEKYRLVYSKSKVYVNPTAYSRDNIPGFVALVKRVSTSRC